MASSPSDDAILATLPADHSAVDIRDLAKLLGVTTRQLAPGVERLAKQGRLLIDRPTGGYRAGARMVRRDGDPPEVLRAKNAQLRTAVQAAVATLTAALEAK